MDEYNQHYTLVGPPVKRLVLAPLAVYSSRTIYIYYFQSCSIVYVWWHKIFWSCSPNSSHIDSVMLIWSCKFPSIKPIASKLKISNIFCFSTKRVGKVPFFYRACRSEKTKEYWKIGDFYWYYVGILLMIQHFSHVEKIKFVL